MGNKNTVKTTIEIDKDLYKQVKIAALNQDKSIKQFLQESLRETIRTTNHAVIKINPMAKYAGMIKGGKAPKDLSQNHSKYWADAVMERQNSYEGNS